MINSEMWELQISTSHGRVTSKRSIFTYALAVLVAAFLWVVSTPQEIYAADAAWQNNSIVYNGNIYVGPADDSMATAFDSRLKDVPVYVYTEPASTTNRKVHILFFTPGIDPGTTDEVNYRTYDYNGPQSFSNGSGTSVVKLEPKDIANNPGTSSCQVDNGLGYVLCPFADMIASWMDGIFDILASFLEVRPVQTNQENAMYRAWSFMRTFANLAFVVAFLIIIYSQVTNFGVSNYGIKKMLPRIVIAVILMNLSYIICSIAIDLSNILGIGLQDLFISIRNSLVGTEGNAWEALTWQNVSSAILSGTALSIGAGISVSSAIIGSGGVAPAAVAILLPALMILLVAVLVALLIMASRQAIITILTILSPLAFVAFLLPNTEKWFDKWRNLFMTMLILFPAFSVIFGGSQLAGAVIIQNADSLYLILLGMIVQVAPLFVTPMLVKLSGSLLGRIAGLVNNPNKGMIDSTRNFAKDRAENMKARNMATPAKPWQAGKRVAQRMDHLRRRREGLRSAHNNLADANWANSKDFSDIDQLTRESADTKTLGETNSAQRYATAKTTDPAIQKLDIEVRNAKATLENLDKEAEVQYKNLQTNPSNLNVIPSHLATQSLIAQRQARESSILDRNLHAATEMRQDQFAEAMISSEALQRQAGGIDPNGAQSALASAVSTMRSSYNKNVEEARAINKHFNLSGSQRQKLALGEEFTARDSHGNTRTFRTSDIFAREAAIEDQMSGQGTVGEMTQIIAKSGTDLSQFRTTISEMMAKNGFGSKTIWGGGKTIDDVAQGLIRGMDDITRAAAEAIAKGKISSADLASADAEGLAIFRTVLDDLPKAKNLISNVELQAKFDSSFIELSNIAKETLTGDERVRVKDNAKADILRFAHATDPTFDPAAIIKAREAKP